MAMIKASYNPHWRRLMAATRRMPLLITAGDRPASIWHAHQEVRIDLRDAWFIRQCRHMLALMKQSHPDLRLNKNNQPITGRTFAAVSASLAAFKLFEAKWYAKRGLTLPTVRVGGLPRIDMYHRTTNGRMASLHAMLRAYHLPVKGPNHTKATSA